MSMRRFGTCSLALLFGLTSGRAIAFCTPVTHYFFVGNTTTDAKCTHDSIGAAINAVVCPNSTIVVTDQLTWASQALIVNDKTISIVGVQGACGNTGPKICDPTIGCGGPPPARIVIGGDGANSVLNITGTSNVTLANLEITGGGSVGLLAGGGVYFSGSGSLALNNVSVHNNVAQNGAGIEFSGGGTLSLAFTDISFNTAVPLSDPSANTDGFGGGIEAGGTASDNLAEIELGPNVSISHNGAADGAGLQISDYTHLLAVADGIAIDRNVATVNGGGLRLGGNATADIGSPGTATEGVINHNQAGSYGGGIRIEQDALDFAGAGRLRLFTTDPARPVSIDANVAGTGGALSTFFNSLTLPFAPQAPSAGAPWTICLFDFRMRNNEATGIGVVFGVIDDGSAIDFHDFALHINTDPEGYCDTPSLSALGATACATSDCNVVSGSINSGNDAQPAVIHVEDALSMHADRLRLSANSSGPALEIYTAAQGAGPQTFSNCLIVGNSPPGSLVALQGAQLTMAGCTFADNVTGTVFEAAASSDLELNDSIVWQPSSLVWTDDDGNSTVHASYVIANELVTLPVDPTDAVADPKFVDAAGGDYHLQPDSPAIDFAPAGGGSTDFDRQPRTVDLAGVANNFGPRDLGAYEYQVGGVSDRIFLGTFD